MNKIRISGVDILADAESQNIQHHHILLQIFTLYHLYKTQAETLPWKHFICHGLSSGPGPCLASEQSFVSTVTTVISATGGGAFCHSNYLKRTKNWSKNDEKTHDYKSRETLTGFHHSQNCKGFAAHDSELDCRCSIADIFVPAELLIIKSRLKDGGVGHRRSQYKLFASFSRGHASVSSLL